MKRRMKQKKYGILRVVSMVGMLLVPFAPLRAEWVYIGSDYSTGPTSGSDSDAYCSWSFSVIDISRSADSSGASTSATCEAESEVDITATTGQSISRNPYASCGTWCRSAYAWGGSPPSDTLTIVWEVSGSGTVKCSGFAYDLYVVTGSLSVSSSASAGIDSHESGTGYTSGSATTMGQDGNANVGTSDYAVEDSKSIGVSPGSYNAELKFSIEGGDTDPQDGLMQFTARAETWASSSSSGSADVTQGTGQVTASSSADFSGSSSVEVSW